MVEIKNHHIYVYTQIQIQLFRYMSEFLWTNNILPLLFDLKMLFFLG